MCSSRVEKRNDDKLLEDFIRYSMRAARGLGSVAEEEGRDLVRRMVESNKVTEEEGEKLLNTLLARMLQSRDVFESKVKESVSIAMSKLSSISTREFDGLKSRVDSIDRRLQNLIVRRMPRAQI